MRNGKNINNGKNNQGNNMYVNNNNNIRNLNNTNARSISTTNNSNINKIVEISPHHFDNKERRNWFGIFTAYTNRYL